MFIRLILYLVILFIGGFIGAKGKIKEKLTKNMDVIQNLCLLFLLFIMGIKIGLDEKVFSSFFKLGFQAIIISSFSIIFSVFSVKIVKGYITKKEESLDES